MKEVRCKNSYIVCLHLYEISRIGKFIETLVVAEVVLSWEKGSDYLMNMDFRDVGNVGTRKMWWLYNTVNILNAMELFFN